MRDEQRHKALVERILDDSDRYAQDLLRENEKLRALAAALEEENRRLDDQLQRQRNETLRELHEIESDSRRYADQYATISQQNAGLANLYVAGYMLHASLERGEVLSAIQQIVVNLVGSEE